MKVEGIRNVGVEAAHGYPGKKNRCGTQQHVVISSGGQRENVACRNIAPGHGSRQRIAIDAARAGRKQLAVSEDQGTTKAPETGEVRRIAGYRIDAKQLG